MTNEQRVRVDRLERYLITDKDNIYTRVRVNDLDTVLSLIKQQQRKIENITTNYEDLIADVSGIAKELGLEEDATIDEIYIAISILKSKRINVIEQLDCIQKKDKQIDLMAKFIENNMSEKKIINEICIKGKCNNEECHEDDLKDCIKQYFERKVEDETK